MLDMPKQIYLLKRLEEFITNFRLILLNLKQIDSIEQIFAFLVHDCRSVVEKIYFTFELYKAGKIFGKFVVVEETSSACLHHVVSSFLERTLEKSLINHIDKAFQKISNET